jgi:hypothetical protein
LPVPTTWPRADHACARRGTRRAPVSRANLEELHSGRNNYKTLQNYKKLRNFEQ